VGLAALAIRIRERCPIRAARSAAPQALVRPSAVFLIFRRARRIVVIGRQQRSV
jgi:hypothetical protein